MSYIMNVSFFVMTGDIIMTDFMRWMYDHYIKPNIESQPIDEGEALQIDLLNNVLNPQMQKNLQEVLAIYATQSFRLGVRTGIALDSDLG